MRLDADPRFPVARLHAESYWRLSWLRADLEHDPDATPALMRFIDVELERRRALMRTTS